MKKIFLALALVTFIIVLTACTGTSDTKDKDDTTNPDTTNPDTTNPVISVNSEKATSFVRGGDEPDWKQYFNVADNIDGNITVTDSMITENVDMEIAGEYYVELNVKDKANNSAKERINIEVTPVFTYSNALAFFKNSEVNIAGRINSTPAGIALNGSKNSERELTSTCENNASANKGEYYYCSLFNTLTPTQSDTNEDIIYLNSQVDNIQNFISKSQEMLDGIGEILPNFNVEIETNDGKINFLKEYGRNKELYVMELKTEYTVGEVSFDFIQAIKVNFDINAQIYTASYNFKIMTGYKFLTTTTYELFAEAEYNSSYDLKRIDIYSRIPLIRTLATNIVIEDDNTIEIASYHSVIGAYDSKTLITTEGNNSYKYKWKKLIGFSAEVTFEVFNSNTKIFESEIKENGTGKSKFYYSAIDGWKQIQYRIEGGFLATDLHDTILTLNDDTTVVFTEKQYDNNEIYYITQAEKAYEYYLDENGEVVKNQLTNSITGEKLETLFLELNFTKGEDIDMFSLPTELNLTLNLNLTSMYENAAYKIRNKKFLNKFMFDDAFTIEIPFYEFSFN